MIEESDDKYILASSKNFEDALTFEKRRALSSTDQLILFQDKIYKKQKIMMQDPSNADKVLRSQQMKEEAE